MGVNKGIIVKSTGSWYQVRTDTGLLVQCRIKGKFRITGIRATNPVAVGDLVEFSLQDDNTGLIHTIEARKNYIIRRSSNLSRHYQLIAANIDQAILIVTLTQPRTLLGFIDRFLVSAEAFRIPVVLLFNKTDLYDEELLEELDLLKILYGKIGYKCISVSLVTGENVEMLHGLFMEKTSVISGNSGVGKSTLIKELDPSVQIRTKEISGFHKAGQHTTANAEMYFLSSGGGIIDTPGIKGFGMVDIEKEELFHFFPEIFEKSKGCKFHNCLHVNEPDCAVIKAVRKHEISESRYFNYLDILQDMDDKYRK